MPLDRSHCAATYKILVLGDASVGKSALLRRLMGREFQERLYPTIATDFVRKCFEVDGALIELQIWDTAGQEKFRSVTRWQFRGVKGVAMIYDITNSDTFTHLAYWIRCVNEEISHTHNKYEVVPIVLIGNKCDLETNRQVRVKDAAKILHSQTLNDKPVETWVITKKEGTVLAAHCSCKAGLGEACSHVAATLYAIEATVKIRDSKTVTQTKAYWLLPAGVRKIDYRPVKDIDFRSAKTQKRHLDELIGNLESAERNNVQADSPSVPDGQNVKLNADSPVLHRPFSKDTVNSSSTVANPHGTSRSRKQSTLGTPPPTADELMNFYTSLKGTGTRPVILSLVKDFQEEYIPVSQTNKYPKILTDLRDQKCVDMGKEDLISHCENVFSALKVSSEEAANVETITKQQTGCKEWYRFRAGRITASRLKSVCRTSIDNPSQSLLKSVCYPLAVKFITVATKWGCDHEKTALEQYQCDMAATHDGLVVEDCGLVINPDYPHLGASPDAVVSCHCCGEGCVEVKCPYCVKDKKLEESLDSQSCLELVNGKLKLKTNHAYYYQIQCQLYVTKKDYCDFVVWTNADMHYERIEPDADFWNIVSQQAKEFFVRVVLLELVGKFYSRPTSVNQFVPGPSDNDTENVKPVKKSKKSSSKTQRNAKANVTFKAKKRKTESMVLKPVASTANSNHDDSFQGKVCICQQEYDPEFDNVIGCDNNECPYVWLHYSCIKLEVVPDGDWFCPSCKS